MRPATSRINRFVSSLTGPLAFRTLETVATDIFASRATSLIVTILLATVDPASDRICPSGIDGRTAELLVDLCLTAQICNRLHRGRQTPFLNSARTGSRHLFGRPLPFPHHGEPLNFRG